MTTDRPIQGAQADNVWRVVRRGEDGWAAASAALRSLGFHQRRNRTSARIEMSAARMSAAYGPHRFETRNWVSAKLEPATSAGAHVSRRPLPLATTHTR